MFIRFSLKELADTEISQTNAYLQRLIYNSFNEPNHLKPNSVILTPSTKNSKMHQSIIIKCETLGLHLKPDFLVEKVGAELVLMLCVQQCLSVHRGITGVGIYNSQSHGPHLGAFSNSQNPISFRGSEGPRIYSKL